ncbi:hypothetical protein [Agrobacterium radiobacter]|uniref:aspartate racemase/maleate isomerase family protein n=1 Tax=Agrobacterium radiobacter TaxID=362 RepID=UPI003CE51D6F
MTPNVSALGIILPSSNRVVERVTRSVLQDFPGVDACFTRVPYAGHPPDGYDLEPFRRATTMLAQARPDVILWNATRGALLGFEPDRRLCAMITSETGIVATTTALATAELLNARRLRRIALLAQGDDAEGAHLVKTFGAEGIEIVASHNFGITDNFEAARVSSDDMERAATRLASDSNPDAILIWSTNLAGHTLTKGLSTRLGVPVLDSTATGTFAALSHIAHADDSRIGARQISA